MGWTNWEKVEGEGFDFTDIIYEKKYRSELGAGIARVATNRPQKYNAFSQHTVDELFRAFYDASHDATMGAVVFTGIGDHFGTGGDMEGGDEWAVRKAYYWRYPPDRVLRTCKIPVIAAVKGFCIGGHNHLAYNCDFTIAADNAIFGQNGPQVASPANGFIVSYLTRAVGAKKAREIWMLCQRYTASEALEMGLVNKVVPLSKLDEEVDKWCEKILSASPACIAMLKATFDAEKDTLAPTGTYLNWLYPDFVDSTEGQEGVQAFSEKRKPDFWKIRMAEAESMKRMRESQKV